MIENQSGSSGAAGGPPSGPARCGMSGSGGIRTRARHPTALVQLYSSCGYYGAVEGLLPTGTATVWPGTAMK